MRLRDDGSLRFRASPLQLDGSRPIIASVDSCDLFLKLLIHHPQTFPACLCSLSPYYCWKADSCTTRGLLLTESITTVATRDQRTPSHQHEQPVKTNIQALTASERSFFASFGAGCDRLFRRPFQTGGFTNSRRSTSSIIINKRTTTIYYSKHQSILLS